MSKIGSPVKAEKWWFAHVFFVLSNLAFIFNALLPLVEAGDYRNQKKSEVVQTMTIWSLSIPVQ